MNINKKTLLFLMCAMVLIGCTETHPITNLVSPSSQSKPLPNIVFILTDDMAETDLAAMPQTLALLGDQGARFNQFFVSTSLCCPSRASILRGQYSHNTQVLSNWEPDGGFSKFARLGLENSTVATWLQTAGYHTVLIGKYLNGYPGHLGDAYIPLGWSEWYSPLEGAEFDYVLNENGKRISYGHQDVDYITDVYSLKAVDFIQRASQANQPFFAYISVFAPHDPSIPAPRHKEAFVSSIALPLSFDEEDVSDKPSFIRDLPRLNDYQISDIRGRYISRQRSLQAVDEMVARIVSELDRLDQLDNTYIFFTSDNGFHLGQHRLPPGKATAYEEDILVPLLVRGPFIKRGTIINELAGNIDLAPTIAQLAGVHPPDFIDGRSLVALLFSEGQVDWRQAILLERLGKIFSTSSATEIATPQLPGVNEFMENDPLLVKLYGINYAGIRTRQYTYIEYENGELELYDLTVDPFQLENIATTVDPSLLSDLHDWLNLLRFCTGESCQNAEALPK